jgi:hypothetical protein
MSRPDALDDPDWTDWSVYSNVAYPLAALPLWPVGGLPFVAILLAGLFLGFSSALYHARYSLFANKLDVTGVIVYLATALTTFAQPYDFWAYLAVPLVGAVYWLFFHRFNITYHAPVWMLACLCLLSYQVGLPSSLSWVLAIVAGLFQLTSGSDSFGHASWHIFGAGALAWANWYMAPLL